MSRLEEIAARIRASGKPLSACVSMPFANGNRATVWGDSLSLVDFVRLQRLVEPEQPPTPEQQAIWRAHRAAAAHD